MLEEARATRPKPPEEHHQRQAPLEADLSSKVGVLQSESGPLNDLQLREQRITQLSNKSAEPVAVPPSPQLSQVFEENRHLSSQFQGSSQRLDEAESRCTALQRQLEELHEDKRKRIGEVDSAPGAPQQHSGPSESESLRVDFEELQRRYQFSTPRHPPLKTHTLHTHVLSTIDQNTHIYITHTRSLYH
nr:golgin subfamily B member 1-like isoform X1 [Oncorhynchus nerka]